jgi:hypothetical protein
MEFAWYPCTTAIIVAANKMIGSGNLVCVLPCPPIMISIDIHVSGQIQLQNGVVSVDYY